MIGRVVRSLNALFWGQVIARVGSLILVPLYLRSWGADTYGEYLSILALVTYLATIDLGITQATINRLTQSFVREDRPDYLRVLHSALAFYMGAAALGTVVVVIAAFFLPLGKWFGLRTLDPVVALTVTIILGAVTLWGLPMRFFFNVYRTTGNMSLTQWLVNGSQIITLVLIAALLWIGKGMIAVSAAQLLGLVVIFGLCFVLVRRDLSWIRLGFTGADMKTIKEVAGLGFLFYLLTLANVLTFQGATLVVANFVGGAAVATFSVIRTLSTFIRLGLESLNAALWPEITRLDETGQTDQLRVLHRLMIGICLVLATGAAAWLWLEGDSFIRIWTGGRLPTDTWLLRLMVLLVVLEVPWLAGYSIAAATNKLRTQVAAYVTASVVGLAAAVVLAPRLGVLGVPIGLILAELAICSHIVLKNTCQLVGEPYGRFALRAWGSLLFIQAAVVGVSYGIQQLLFNTPWLIRASGVGMISFGAASLLGWVLWLNAEERTRLKQVLDRLYRRLAPAPAA